MFHIAFLADLRGENVVFWIFWDGEYDGEVCFTELRFGTAVLCSMGFSVFHELAACSIYTSLSIRELQIGLWGLFGTGNKMAWSILSNKHSVLQYCIPWDSRYSMNYAHVPYGFPSRFEG